MIYLISVYKLATNLRAIRDINLDGAVNLLDVNPFVQALISEKYIVDADMNADGFVDILDVAPFVQKLGG